VCMYVCVCVCMNVCVCGSSFKSFSVSEFLVFGTILLDMGILQTRHDIL